MNKPKQTLTDLFGYDRPNSSRNNRNNKKDLRISDGPKFRLLEKHKHELYDIFEMLDDGTGTIKVKDLQAVLKGMNYAPDEMEMKRLFKGVKGDKITIETMVTIMENKLSEEETKDDLKRIFCSFDYDSKGYITFGNLKRLANELEIDINDEELTEMICEADLNQDGVVTEEEFLKIMLRVEF